jgi:hypothetical protein
MYQNHGTKVMGVPSTISPLGDGTGTNPKAKHANFPAHRHHAPAASPKARPR